MTTTETILQELTDSNAQEIIESGVTVVFFWSDSCRPCLQVRPFLEEFSSSGDFPGVKFAAFDIDYNPNFPNVHGVRGIPTISIFKNGEKKAESIGAQPKGRIIAFLREHVPQAARKIGGSPI